MATASIPDITAGSKRSKVNARPKEHRVKFRCPCCDASDRLYLVDGLMEYHIAFEHGLDAPGVALHLQADTDTASAIESPSVKYGGHVKAASEGGDAGIMASSGRSTTLSCPFKACTTRFVLSSSFAVHCARETHQLEQSYSTAFADAHIASAASALSTQFIKPPSAPSLVIEESPPPAVPAAAPPVPAIKLSLKDLLLLQFSPFVCEMDYASSWHSLDMDALQAVFSQCRPVALTGCWTYPSSAGKLYEKVAVLRFGPGSELNVSAETDTVQAASTPAGATAATAAAAVSLVDDQIDT